MFKFILFSYKIIDISLDDGIEFLTFFTLGIHKIIKY